VAKSINRNFQFIGTAKNVRSGQLWYPAADVYEAPGGWVVKVELAGVSAEDIEIDIQGNVLYIAGCRKDRSCSVGMSFQQMEIAYSSFEKTLKFPSNIDGATVEHNFDNGLLIINLQKA